MASAVHLILFSRAPVPGATKTRLAAAGLGAAAAREFHVACLLDILDEALAWQAQPPPGAAVRLHAFLTPAGALAEFERAGVHWPPLLRVHDQAGGTLGERMHDALQAVLAGEPGRALLIGTDLPLLRRELLTDACNALDATDVVFGPTPDGGYYLVGLRQAERELFERPAWGQGSVLRQSLDAAAALGLRSATLAPLPDVDVADDVSGVLAHATAGALAHRRAVTLLRRWAAEGRLPRPSR